MQAIVLAAGEGTRLGPFTYSEPKVMIPVGNRPILEHVVEALVGNGIRDIVLVVGYRKERIMTHFEDGKAFGATITYVDQPKQLGTAHALLQAKEAIEDDFLVLPGDNIIDAQTVKDLLAAKRVPALVITESENPSKYGVVILKGEAVQDLLEKPEERISNLINTGIYALQPEFLALCEEFVGRGIYDLPGILQKLAKQDPLLAIPTQGTWIDAVFPWDLIRVNAAALAGLEGPVAGKVEEGVVLRGSVTIGEGTVVRAGAYLLGPIAIGAGCDIGPHVTIYPSTSIGQNVTLGASSVIEESVIMDDCSLGGFTYLSHSVLGKGVRAGSHFAVPSGDATVHVDGEVQTIADIGAFLGEDTLLGSGVRVPSGTLVGARCRVGTGATIRENLPHGATVL